MLKQKLFRQFVIAMVALLLTQTGDVLAEPIEIVLNEDTCVNLALGSWDNDSQTCETNTTIDIPVDQIFVIPAGVTLTSGNTLFFEDGTFNNFGSITADTIRIDASVVINNNGILSIASSGELENDGTIYNGCNGIIDVADLNINGFGSIIYICTDSDGDGITDNADSCPFENATGSDANGDGCIDTIDDLSEIVTAMNLHRGLENALLSKISNAQAALVQGDSAAAQDKLNAFIHQVEAQHGKKISEAQADILIALAQNVLADI